MMKYMESILPFVIGCLIGQVILKLAYVLFGCATGTRCPSCGKNEMGWTSEKGERMCRACGCVVSEGERDGSDQKDESDVRGE